MIAQTAASFLLGTALGGPITPTSEDCESKSIKSHCTVTTLPKV